MAPPAASAPLLPPRPNLGPEPLAPAALGPAWAAALIVLAVALGVLVWWLSKRQRGHGRERGARSMSATLEQALRAGRAGDPEHRLVAWAESVRRALVARFGAHWAAKTTEEVAREVELAALVGPERMGQLARLLQAADRVKFSAAQADAAQGDAWEPWVESLLADLTRAAGATSRINGR